MDGGAKRNGGRSAVVASQHIRRTQLILIGLLLVLAIVGVRAGPSLRWTSSWRGPLHDHGTAIGVVLELILGALLIALLVHGRRSPQAGWPADGLRRALRPLIILAMIALAVTLVRLHLVHGPLRKSLLPPRHLRPGPTRTPPVTKQHVIRAPALPLATFEYVLLALLVLAIIAAFVILFTRRRRHLGDDTDLAPEDDEGDALRTAVQAGRLALAGLTEARKAIIACYLAMEGSLSEAGAARAVAETPDELLARASAGGLLHGKPPATLTALFYQARFSSGPLPANARQVAMDALDAILAGLRTTSATKPHERTS